MNVLEKILEEIEERIKRLNEADNMCRVNAERNRNFESMKYFQSLMFATERAESIIGDIIRSHMDELGCDERLVKKFVTNREIIRDFNDKPIYIKGCCPKCGCELKACESAYCRVCGQALNWNNPKGGL